MSTVVRMDSRFISLLFHGCHKYGTFERRDFGRPKEELFAIDLRRQLRLDSVGSLHALHDFGIGQRLVGFLGALEDPVDQLLGRGISWRSSQNCTFDLPLMGPTSMTCSMPKKCEGTPE